MFSESVRMLSVNNAHYFDYVLATFLGLGTLQLRCCQCRVRKFSYFIKNILICVPKMNEGLTGLERHEDE